jgi:hypothetical protein
MRRTAAVADQSVSVTRTASETLTLVLGGTVLSVGALVSVVFDEHDVSSPFLFLPEDFRRCGIEPRAGGRYLLELAVVIEGQTLRRISLVGLDVP